MKQTITTRMLGLLAIAAALTMGATGCSNDDMAVEEAQPTTATGTIQVTVGAGIGDGMATRSAVDYNTSKKQRTLQFSTGDKLYVRGDIGELLTDANSVQYYAKIAAGYLDVTAIDPSDPTRATFSGTLSIYKANTDIINIIGSGIIGSGTESFIFMGDYWAPTTHEFSTDNPLGECTGVTATLVHAGNEGNFGVDAFRVGSFGNDVMATDVNALMTSALTVSGNYSSGSFTLSATQPVMNWNISGLAAGTYNVYYKYGTTESLDHAFNVGTITSDGTAAFASLGAAGTNYQALHFVPDDRIDEFYKVNLGQKTLTGKVYNVTREAQFVNDNFANVTSDHIGYVVGSDGRLYAPGTALPDGVAKSAMIAYVSSVGHGLAIQLNDNPPIYEPSAPAAVPGRTWKIPSKEQWENMVDACKTNSIPLELSKGFCEKYSATGVNFQPTTYWTSTYERAETDFYYYYIGFEAVYYYPDTTMLSCSVNYGSSMKPASDIHYSLK